MKIIIGGAGKIGFKIAQYLSVKGDNNVTIIDESPQFISKVNHSLDVQALLGVVSDPEILNRANASQAEILIALTESDEINMMACLVADTLFTIPTKIARIHKQSYRNPTWGKLFHYDVLPIDEVICPEEEIANRIVSRLEIPKTLDMIVHTNDRLRTIGIVCGRECPLLHTPLRQLTKLFPDLKLQILAIIRRDKPIIPDSDDQLLEEDEVYFIVDSGQVERAMRVFGYDDLSLQGRNRRLLILGGGEIGYFLAQIIEDRYPEIEARIIELSSERAEFLSQNLKRIEVLQGDILDYDILEEASIAEAQAVVTVTNDDETNILGALLGKHYRCPQNIALFNKSEYSNLISNLGIYTVNPGIITVSHVLQLIRRGRVQAVHSLRTGFAEIIEADISPTSAMVNKSIKSLRFPSGILVGALVREGEAIIVKPDTVIYAEDRIILLATSEQLKNVDKIFSERG